MGNHPNRHKDQLVTMPKAEFLERLNLMARFTPHDDLTTAEHVLTVPIDTIRDQLRALEQKRPVKEGVNLGEPKANATLEDQVYAVLNGRNFEHPDWHLDLEDLLETKFDGLNLTEQVEGMICQVVAHRIGDRLGWTMEQRETLAGLMNGCDQISEHLTFESENGVGYSDKLVEEIAKAAIEAAHDVDTDEPGLSPQAVSAVEFHKLPSDQVFGAGR